MKTIYQYILFLIPATIINACETEKTDRSVSELPFVAESYPAGPVYSTPPCYDSLKDNTVRSDVDMFNVTFKDGPSESVVYGKYTTIEINNSNLDKAKITLAPFHPEQSTVYKLVSSFSTYNYEAKLNLVLNCLAKDFKYDIRPDKDEYLYVRYRGNNEYELMFCDTRCFCTGNGNTYMHDLSGKIMVSP